MAVWACGTLPKVCLTIDPYDDDTMTTLGMMYLDGSHPEVPAYLAGQFKQMVEDYKPTFMKWDHHYGSLEEADRYDPTVTGLQSHNLAVRWSSGTHVSSKEDPTDAAAVRARRRGIAIHRHNTPPTSRRWYRV